MKSKIHFYYFLVNKDEQLPNFCVWWSLNQVFMTSNLTVLLKRSTHNSKGKWDAILPHEVFVLFKRGWVEGGERGNLLRKCQKCFSFNECILFLGLECDFCIKGFNEVFIAIFSHYSLYFNFIAQNLIIILCQRLETNSFRCLPRPQVMNY